MKGYDLIAKGLPCLGVVLSYPEAKKQKLTNDGNFVKKAKRDGRWA